MLQFTGTSRELVRLTSPDGANWFGLSKDSFGQPFQVSENGFYFRFDFIGAAQQLWSSPDGFEWTLRHVGASSIADLTYGNAIVCGSRLVWRNRDLERRAELV